MISVVDKNYYHEQKGNPACPKKSSKELAQAVAPYKELLTKKEKKLIQNLVEDMEQFAPRAGGFSRASCSKSLCQLNCIYLRKYKNYLLSVSLLVKHSFYQMTLINSGYFY